MANGCFIFIITFILIFTGTVVETCRTICYTRNLDITKMIDCDQDLVLVGVCLTESNNNSTLSLFGYCPYFTAREVINVYGYYYYHINFSSQLTEQTCGPLNRKGLLCSECFEGYGPAVFAFGSKCVKCHGSVYGRWALYLFVVLFPVTVFYVIIIIFNIHAASPPFTAYVLYCQTFAILDRIYFPGKTNVDIHDQSQALLLLAREFSGLWNLDFGRYVIPPFCVDENLSTYHALFLDYILAFYPMILIFITYILIKLHGQNFKPLVFVWRPFHRCFARVRRTWDSKASIVNAFATFLLLSFFKILFVSSYPFQKEIIRCIKGNNKNCFVTDYLFYNPNIRVFSNQNILFIVLGLSVAMIFALIPTLILCCYQVKIIRNLIIFCCCGKQHTIDMFMDTFQGHYKDGTNGNYDLRFLSGLYPFLRIMFLLAVHKHITRHFCQVRILICFIFSLIIAFTRPYKRFSHNFIETLLLFLTTFMVWNCREFLTIDVVQSSRLIIALPQLIPHLMLISIAIYRVLKLMLHRFETTTYDNRFISVLLCLDRVWNKFKKAITGAEAKPLLAKYIPTKAYGTI